MPHAPHRVPLLLVLVVLVLVAGLGWRELRRARLLPQEAAGTTRI